MSNDRTRPFIEEPVFHGCPISWARKYFQSQVEKYRKNFGEFDTFLLEIKEEIQKRNLKYCDNILKLINGESEANWVSPKKSLFRQLIKLFNYDFSGKQAVDYIERCYKSYQRLLNDKLLMGNEYEIFTTRTMWDSSTRDFIKLALCPKQKDLLELEPYFINVTFCSLQVDRGSYPYNPGIASDDAISIAADDSTFEDALYLFDYYNGNLFVKHVFDKATSELEKNKIIEKLCEYKAGFSKCTLYRVMVKRCYKVDESK